MVESSGAVVRRFVEEFQGNGRQDVGEDLLAADFRNRTPDPGSADDRQSVLEQFAKLHTAFPDLRVEVHQMLVDGDRVATHKSFHGTHKGDLMGMPPTGWRITLEVMDIVRVQDGQIVEHWNVVNQLALLRQFGARGIALSLCRRLVRSIRPGHKRR